MINDYGRLERRQPGTGKTRAEGIEGMVGLLDKRAVLEEGDAVC